MSFILDALKKAETRRGPPQPVVPNETPLGDIAPRQDQHRRVPFTTLALASGMIVIAALAWWLGRQSSPADALAGTAGPDIMMQLPADDGTREIRPLDREADRSTRRAAPARTTVTGDSVPPASQRVIQDQPRTAGFNASRQQAARPAEASENVPGYEEIVLSGRVQLPALHLDVHVYADAPERRFVFINNRKYRQNEQLDEGGLVERITSRGAILNFRGHRFELAPD